MKVRFLITILLVVLVSVVSVSFVFSYFFNTERDQMINQQIETHASLLLSSGLSNAQLEDFEEAEGIITNVLGGSRINQVIVIYNRSGKVIYRNKNAALLKLEAPFLDTWTTLQIDNHTVKLLTVPFPAKKRVLQIGLVFNQTLDQWDVISQRVWVYIALILALTLVISVLLTTLLVRPFKKLAAYLKHLAQTFELDVTQNRKSPPMPFLKRAGKRQTLDEFSQLTYSIYDLIEKLKSVFRQTHARSAQLAHELKTPLTIMHNNLEELIQSAEPSQKTRIQECLYETDHLGKTIQSFLEWSVAENTPGAPEDIHAIHAAAFIERIVHSLERIHPDRLKFKSAEEFTVFSKPEHLDQVVSNLIVNALKYSPTPSPVRVTLGRDSLTIEDQGPGLPTKVLDRIGTPFNFGNQQTNPTLRGSGLGLAWVRTLCNKYRWKLHFDSRPSGTKAIIHFVVE